MTAKTARESLNQAQAELATAKQYLLNVAQDIIDEFETAESSTQLERRLVQRAKRVDGYNFGISATLDN